MIQVYYLNIFLYYNMTQAEKFIKVQSLQSGNFTKTNNHVDFVIPTGTYDLSNSYVALNVLPNVIPFTVNGANDPKGLVPYVISNPGLERYESVMNGVFVKTAALKSDRVGELENIRNTNVIHYNLWQLTNSYEEKESYNYLSTSPIVSPFNIIDMAGSKLNKIGTTATDLTTPYEIQIPVSEFLRLGTMKQFNTAKMGDLRMKLELDLDIRATPFMVSDATTQIDKDLAFGGESNRGFEAIGANVAAITTITTGESIGFELSRSPYFVGQAITINMTGQGGIGDKTETAVITEIATNNNLQLVLTLSRDIGSTGAAEGYDITVSGFDPPAEYLSGITFNTAELRLKQVPDVAMDELTYITVVNESDNGNQLILYRKQFYLEPECVGVSMIHTYNANGISNRGGNIDYYRLDIDNTDVVGNRNVGNRSSLQKELLNKMMVNLGLPVKNYSQHDTRTNQSYIDRFVFPSPSSPAFVGCPTAQTPNRKVLDLSLEMKAGSGLRWIELFKFVVKTVNL